MENSANGRIYSRVGCNWDGVLLLCDVQGKNKVGNFAHFRFGLTVFSFKLYTCRLPCNKYTLHC